MAAISRSRRSSSGIALIVAGALFVLAILLPLIGIAFPWFFVLGYAAMAVAFVLLGLGAVNNTVAKIALFAAAVGWALLVLGALGVGLPGVLVSIAAVVAGVGGLIAAIVLYVGKQITNTPAMAFVIATILGVFFVLGLVGTFAFGTLGVVITVLFGVALIATGVLFRRTEGSRR